MIDVIVIGGGPAGSTAATMLARKGREVLLLERERFPRDHIGESLLPASLPVLEELGVREAVERAGFLKKWGATMVWGREPEPWSWYFKETNARYPHAYQVWRPQFDQILLENSARNGVTVRQGCRVLDVELNGLERMAVVFLDEAGERTRLACRFVVDASGQTGLIGRKLGLRESDSEFQNLAVYSYFAGAERLPPPDETNILIESYEHGWLWLIPLHNGLMSVGAVVDQRRGGEALRTLGAETFLQQQITRAPQASAMLHAAQRAQPVAVVRDWSYSSRELSGDGWALAGDAACFIDPLFSTGVHLALSAGVLAAALAETALKDPPLAQAAAPVYRELYDSQYSLFRQLVRLFYATNRTVDSYFWEARRIVGDESLSPRSAFVRAVAGRPPAGYERAVLERGELPDALMVGMQAVTGERDERRRQFASLVESGAVSAAVPALADGAHVERRPALGEGEFVPGFALLRPGAEAVPLSAFVALLLSHVDGRRALSAVLELLAARAGSDPAAITAPALQALATLYADGALELTVPAGAVRKQ